MIASANKYRHIIFWSPTFFVPTSESWLLPIHTLRNLHRARNVDSRNASSFTYSCIVASSSYFLPDPLRSAGWSGERRVAYVCIYDAKMLSSQQFPMLRDEYSIFLPSIQFHRFILSAFHRHAERSQLATRSHQVHSPTHHVYYFSLNCVFLFNRPPEIWLRWHFPHFK